MLAGEDRERAASLSRSERGESSQRAIAAFRSDSRQIVATIGQAALAGDTLAFEQGLGALRDCTSHLGSGRLRDLLQSMHGRNSAELRRQGTEYVQRLLGELARLDAVAVERLRAAN